MKVDHNNEGFGSIKVKVRCRNDNCMFHHDEKPTCALYMPWIIKGKCWTYTPIDKGKQGE